ncbi:MAG TPA: glycosyltransferase family 2 protein, partial [Burkholderiales bacterium]
ELLLGLPLVLFSLVFGTLRWVQSIESGVPVTAGTAMLAGLPLVLGAQLLLSFLAYDTRAGPTVPLHRRL